MDLGVSEIGQQQQQSFDVIANQDALDRDAFLNLLVTQLRHQDPLDPMENTEFIAQLAQFSSLEQMQNVSTGIQDLSVLMQSVNNSMATGLIGKDVKYDGDTFRLAEGEDGRMHIYLASDANVRIKVYDENNELVANVIRGDVDAGHQVIEWDGLNIDGERMNPGRYRFEVEATDSNGETVKVATFAVDRVRGLKFDSGNAILMVADKELYLADILEILEPINE